MATYVWTLQGTTPTTIAATDILQFAGLSFGNAIFVGNYQDSMHVKTSGGTNKSLGHSPHNTKYVSIDHMILDGSASTLLTDVSLTTAKCPLKINFSHPTSVIITNHIFYAYSGGLTTNPPVDVDFKAAEFGDTQWTSANGSGAALGLADHASADSHDFFLLVSASPTAVGLKQQFVLRDELIYT